MMDGAQHTRSASSSSSTSHGQPEAYATAKSKQSPKHEWNSTTRYSRTRKVDNLEEVAKIKRPMNAFMVWSQIRRAQIASSDLKIHNSEISKELGAEWRRMNAEEKAPFIQKAKELREELFRLHPDYVYRPKRKSRSRVSVYESHLPHNSNDITMNRRRQLLEQQQQQQQKQRQRQQQQRQQQQQQQQTQQAQQHQLITPLSMQMQQQYNLLLNMYSSQLLAAASVLPNVEKPSNTLDTESNDRQSSALAQAIGCPPFHHSFIDQSSMFMPTPVNPLATLNSNINPALLAHLIQPSINLGPS